MDQVAHSDVPHVSLGEATRVFARIGLMSFGGPAGQIALMHRVLVEEKRWLDESRFLHALNYCMLLPGPEAMQLATYSGWLLHGTRGGLIAGVLFVLPGAVIITLLSAIYFSLGHVPAVQGLLFGLKAAVLAIVLEALVKVGRRALKGPVELTNALAAFVAIALLKLPFPLVVLGAGAIGAVWSKLAPSRSAEAIVTSPVASPDWSKPSASRFAKTLVLWLAIWLVPLLALASMLGGQHVLVTEAVFFSKMAAVTFGGAYAVLTYVAQQAVDTYGWIKPDEMLTGLGLAETTPGPLILVLAYVGFLGGARLSGIEPILGGLAGVAVTLWFTFVPCFLWIFVGAPYIETVRNIRWLAGALAAVTAAVVGIIANLAIWFGLHVLFGRVDEVDFGGFPLPLPDVATFDWAAFALAAAAAVALLRYRLNILLVLVMAALAGIVVSAG